MVVSHYEHYCMTDKHIEQLKYILGVAGHTSDSVVFLIVGQQFWKACSQAPEGWNPGFIIIAYVSHTLSHHRGRCEICERKEGHRNDD